MIKINKTKWGTALTFLNEAQNSVEATRKETDK